MLRMGGGRRKKKNHDIIIRSNQNDQIYQSYVIKIVVIIDCSKIISNFKYNFPCTIPKRTNKIHQHFSSFAVIDTPTYAGETGVLHLGGLT